MTFKIGDKEIGDNNPCYIIAEAGINHNGNITIAKDLIDAAKKSGADAIKFQTYKADDLISDKSLMWTYTHKNKKYEISYYDLIKSCELKEEEWSILKDYCDYKKIEFFSTTVSKIDLKMMLDIGMRVIKIPSSDITNIPLIDDRTKLEYPVIISTGLGNWNEIDDALCTAIKNNNKIVAMHCVSQYPTPENNLNLSKITELKRRYPQIVIGFSDHSEGIDSATIAVSLGAKVYEKHFTMNREMIGPDHSFSTTPEEFKQIVHNIRKVETMLGDKNTINSYESQKSRDNMLKSVVATKDIKKGDLFSYKNLGVKRPGTGLKPIFIKDAVGCICLRDIKKGEILKYTDWEKK